MLRPEAVARARLALVMGGLLMGLAMAVTLYAFLGPRRLPEYVIEDPADGRSYFQADPDLGYAPAAGVRVRASRRHEGETIYDVRYSIDEHGLRVTPGSRREGRAVLFFGGSFTFGEGVDDEDALPARFASWMGGDTRIVNAGFHGYGPHQMLRALETHRLDPLVPDGVEQVVYQGIDGHVMRVAGRAIWDLTGPRYEVFLTSGRSVRRRKRHSQKP